MKNYLNKSINANYIDHGATLTGRLLFREDDFLYKANSVNGVLIMNILNYENILSIELKNTFGVIPNGLVIRTTNNDEYFYVLFERTPVKDFLETKMREKQRVEK